MAQHSEDQADRTPDQQDATGTEPAPAGGIKDQFRAALERKRGTAADGVGGPSGSGSKIHEAHGRAAAKRQFRRKSGG